MWALSSAMRTERGMRREEQLSRSVSIPEWLYSGANPFQKSMPSLGAAAFKVGVSNPLVSHHGLERE
jgi:hypothetical protein